MNGVRRCGATSSSTVGWGGEPDRVIDKNTDTDWQQSSCSHTDAGSESTNMNGIQHGSAWWQVDLGGVAQIDQVNIWHRTDCCQDRLESAMIYISQSDPIDPTTGRFNPQMAQACGTLSDHTHAPEVSQCNSAQGQFITVVHDRLAAGGTSGGSVITICEAEVWGVLNQPPTWMAAGPAPPMPPAPPPKSQYSPAPAPGIASHNCVCTGGVCVPAGCEKSLCEGGDPVIRGARNLLKNVPTGNCQFDPCVANRQCSLTTPNALGGGQSGTNGIRICGATRSSTVGWGGEPDRAVDQRSVRGAPLPCRAIMLCPHRDSPYE